MQGMPTLRKNKAIRPTGKRLADLLPKIMSKIGKMHKVRPDLVVSAWPEVIGKRFAAMTSAVSFVDGILTVKVKNSTLLSVLSQHEKPRLMGKLKEIIHFVNRDEQVEIHLPDGRSFYSMMLYRPDADLEKVFGKHKVHHKFGWSPAMAWMSPGCRIPDVRTNTPNCFVIGDFDRYPGVEPSIFTAQKAASIIRKVGQ